MAETGKQEGVFGVIEEVTGADLRVGDVIVVQAIPMQVERLISAEPGGSESSPSTGWNLQGAGVRDIRDDDPVLRLDG